MLDENSKSSDEYDKLERILIHPMTKVSKVEPILLILNHGLSGLHRMHGEEKIQF